MKKTIKIFIIAVIGSTNFTNHASAQDVLMRYLNVSSGIQLSIKQDIYTGPEETHRSDRKMELGMKISNHGQSKDVEVTIKQASGFINVHGMTQRLSGSYLEKFSFPMNLSDDHQSLRLADEGGNPELDLGQSFAQGLPIGATLIDIFPVLPSSTISVGSEWTSSNEVKILEGWSWAKGIISSVHKVTEINIVNGHQVVTVSSTGEAQLGDSGGVRAYGENGSLSRTAKWTFDVTEGQLLFLTFEQITNGTNQLQPGKDPRAIRQVTKVKFDSVRK